MADSRDDVKWSLRAPKWKLRRFCERVAQRVLDDELIGDVGMPLFGGDPLIQLSDLVARLGCIAL